MISNNDNMLEGVSLSSYDEELRYVPVNLNHKPILSFDCLDEMSNGKGREILEYYNEQDPCEIIHKLPANAFLKLSADHAAKAMQSRQHTISGRVEEELYEQPILHIVDKIKSSMWRWGCRRAPWNEIVDAYNGIRNFDLGIDRLKTTLSYTEYVNAKGWSCHNATFLDGVFAFFIHYKGKHVLTIGFTIVAGRRILLQQIQAKSATGNRWMFKMPKNKTEFIVERITAAFPRHKILIADGANYADRSLKEYEDSLERHKGRLANKMKFDGFSNLSDLHEQIEALAAKIAHLKSDKARISNIYTNVGRFVLGQEFSANNMKHYEINDPCQDLGSAGHSKAA